MNEAIATEISSFDEHLFNEGTHLKLYDMLGAHPTHVDGRASVRFAVWAPSARSASVIGDFNGWKPGATPLSPLGSTGIWQALVPGVERGAHYKYHVVGSDGRGREKSDPIGFFHESPPKTASIVWDLDYAWEDEDWMESRGARNALDAPMSIYEVHLGSWMRATVEGNRSLTYRELAPRLVDHVKSCGFTHVEMLPVMEHPFFGSWGYQTTGYFAPSNRYGTPQDFMYLIDQLHQNGIGVILDWVPSHFPADDHGPGSFDGTHLYEHADPRQGYHPDWNSYIFNYGRNEVRSFLMSSALFWLDKYHADGLRVDAVASMLYLDYSRKDGEWIPNEYGGNENLEAISFLRKLNEEIYAAFPDVQTIAEESTSWPMVSRPTYLGGLGFGLKWDMGWMHDTLQYMRRDPIHRKYHHGELTFRMMYAFNENFVLSLSHDEVVHGKGSLLAKMPGDDWQKRANLRLLYAYMYGLPGKKLLFMGQEFGQWSEWNHDGQLSWEQAADERHAGIQRWMGHLNRLYSGEPALHARDCDPAGFQWVELNDWEHSVIAFERRGGDAPPVLVVCNFTPTPLHNYQLGVDKMGRWEEVANSDAREYGGSGQGNLGGVEAAPLPSHGRSFSLNLTVPPLGAVFLRAPS